MIFTYFRRSILPVIFLCTFCACTHTLQTPSESRGFDRPATHKELTEFLKELDKTSDRLRLEQYGESAGGRPLWVIKSQDPLNRPEGEVLRVLLFAQQHGNEPSGKEACLLLARDLAQKALDYTLPGMELWIVPVANPDGAEVHQRRTSQGIDMNRDHIVMEAPETRFLRDLFHDFMPHVTVDVHEYQPFRQTWEEFGGFKHFDVQVGMLTNPNTDSTLRAFSGSQVLPAIEQHLKARGYSFHNYLVGPVPTQGRTRHSTVDFDDGRQGFGILGSLALIYEGINGRENVSDNLARRAVSQYEALKGLLEFLQLHQDEVSHMVENARNKLREASEGETVAIRMEHFPGDEFLELPLISSRTGKDTLVLVENYHPKVKITFAISRPKGYLVPGNDVSLIQFLEDHRIAFTDDWEDLPISIIRYHIQDISTRVEEELETYWLEVRPQRIHARDLEQPYVFVPVSQLHANFLVQVFEPQSMLGLFQRDPYQWMIQESETYPVLRVESR
jgi:hypothetical protein